jgi:Kdo2-lipid IVA lauroyltransferase/acyltransferase
MSQKKSAGKATFRIVKFLLFLTRVFPLGFGYGFCSFIAYTGSVIKWKRSKIALNNLDIVFPEKTVSEKKAIYRESLRNMLKSFYEFAYIINGKCTAEEVLKMADASGLEYLDELKTMKQGAILYSGHFGNFPLMIIWLAFKGYPIAAIYKEASNLPDDFFGNHMKKFNITPLTYKSEVSLTMAVIRALREGNIVLIQNDQSHPRGIYIDFFNKSVPSPAGPALLAKRVGVPVIPAYICRDNNNHHKITILPEIPLQEEDDQETFLRLNTQIQINWIAELLLKNPTEWLWLHNRWKRERKDVRGEM